MLDEADIAWGLLGIFATLGGVGTLIWGVASWSLKNRQEHLEILRVMNEMHKVMSKLDDVLSHPGDTTFSVEPLRNELEQIRDELRRLRNS